MRDPMTLAFSIPNPFARRYPWAKRWRDRSALIDIWHVDPETDGSDDSCDWRNQKGGTSFADRSLWKALDSAETLFGNPPHWRSRSEFSREYAAVAQIRKWAIKVLRRPSRTRWWQLHPRWHVHHWRVVVVPLLAFKRWAFSRCEGCGRRFPWGYAPISEWDSGGPRWFRSEQHVYHHECDRGRVRPPGNGGATDNHRAMVH